MLPKRKESVRPSVARITRLAIMVLEEAAQEARFYPVKRSAAHRLALAWLTYMDFASTMQADSFWRILGHQGSYATGKEGDFRRKADIDTFLNSWRRQMR